MTRKDYFEWAKEYKQQVDILTDKIKKKEALRRTRFKRVKDKIENERSLLVLYEMRNDCLYTMNELMKKAKSMEDNNE